MLLSWYESSLVFVSTKLLFVCFCFLLCFPYAPISASRSFLHRWIVSPGEGADKVISYRRMTYLRIMLSAHPMCSEWLWSPTSSLHTSIASALHSCVNNTNIADSLPINHPLRILFTRLTNRNRLPLGPSPPHRLSPRLRRQRPRTMVPLGLPRSRLHDLRPNSSRRGFHGPVGCTFTSIFNRGMASAGRETVRYTCLVYEFVS